LSIDAQGSLLKLLFVVHAQVPAAEIVVCSCAGLSQDSAAEGVSVYLLLN
jgi:hypothetical protein